MKRFILAALAAAMLLGCGGGGGGSENTGAGTNTVPGPIILNAAFEPKEAQTSIFENQTFRNSYNNLELFITTLNVDGIDPTKVFPVITADKPIFSRLDIGVSNLSRKLEMSVQLSTQIPAGIHTGKVTVTLYKDAAKTQAYTLSNGGVFLYTINVDPELVITVKIDGVIQAQRISSSNTGVVGIDRNTIYWGGEPAGPPAAFRLKPGQIIELTSSIPVIWYGPHGRYPYGELWEAPVQTETTFRQVTMPLLNTPSMSGTPIIAMPKSASKQWGAGFVVDVFP